MADFDDLPQRAFAPRLTRMQGDVEDPYSTADILNNMPQPTFTDWLRQNAPEGGAPDDSTPWSQFASRVARTGKNIVGGGMNTVANWLDWKPKVGPDTIAPTGFSLMGTSLAHAVGAMPKEAIGSAGGKLSSPLPMDEASRLNRAREMGFDTETPLYHGSADDFAEFSLDAKSRHIPLPGISLTPDPKIANAYAWNAGMQKALEAGLLKDSSDPIGGNVRPVYARMRNPFEYDFATDANKGHASPEVVRSMLDRARAQGHDGAILRNWKDGSGPVQYISFDPSNIRSKFAAFNPADSDKAGLLLSDQSRASVPGTVINALGEQQLPERAFKDKSMVQANASTRPDTGLGHPTAVQGAKRQSVAQMRAMLGDERGGNPMSGRRLGPNDFKSILERQRATEGMRAAMRDPETGKVYTGWSHQGAINSIPPSDTTGAWGRLSGEWDRGTDNTGFIDKAGNFVSRSDAERNFGITTMEDLKDLRAGKGGGRLYSKNDNQLGTAINALGEAQASGLKKQESSAFGLGHPDSVPGAQGIRAFHGSPHDFDKFDPDSPVHWLTEDRRTAVEFGKDRMGIDPPGSSYYNATKWRDADPNVYEALINSGKVMTVDPVDEASKIAKQIGVDPPKNWDEVSELLVWSKAQEQWLDEARQKGMDAVRFLNVGDAPGKFSSTHVAVVNPEVLEIISRERASAPERAFKPVKD